MQEPPAAHLESFYCLIHPGAGAAESQLSLQTGRWGGGEEEGKGRYSHVSVLKGQPGGSGTPANLHGSAPRPENGMEDPGREDWPLGPCSIWARGLRLGESGCLGVGGWGCQRQMRSGTLPARALGGVSRCVLGRYRRVQPQEEETEAPGAWVRPATGHMVRKGGGWI